MTREIWLVSNLPPPVHGVSVFNAELCEELDRLGIAHRVFRIGTTRNLEDVQRFGVRKLVADARTLGALASTRRHAPAVIYFTPSRAGAAVVRDAALATLARSLRIPLVAHLHGCAWLDDWNRHTWEARVTLQVLRQCERVVCLGPTYATRMHEVTGLPCVGINNGVRAPLAGTPKSLRGANRIELLYLSNLIRSKGLWTAAAAAVALHERGLAVRLRCAGNWLRDAERREFLRDFAAPLANGLIELVGFADAATKATLLAGSHVFLLPTEYPLEGQPLSIIEAMANGLVPITTIQGGIADLFATIDGWSQLASPRHRAPDAVAATIAALHADPERFERLGAACLQRYREALTLDRCIEQLLSVLVH